MNVINRVLFFIFAIFISVSAVYSADDELDKELQTALNTFRIKTDKKLGISLGMSMSVYIPWRSEKIYNYVSGVTPSPPLPLSSRQKEITPKNFFEIGSITKSFTSVVALQLQKEGKLNINDNVGKYFP